MPTATPLPSLPPITPRRRNRAVLARQLLLRRERLAPADAVARVVALQAQEPASPYLALWNRLEAFEPADLDAAFARRDVVKATLMRGTQHAVAAADWPPFFRAMTRTLRTMRLNDRRFLAGGITAEQADALVERLLGFTDGTPRMRPELEAFLATEAGPAGEQAAVPTWWAAKTFGPFHHAPTGGPWSFGVKNAYLAPHVPQDLGDPIDALAHLVRRYLEGFGPASLQDIVAFKMGFTPDAKAAVERLERDGRVIRLRAADGATLFDVPGAPLPDEDVPAPPRLLGMWDEVLLAHRDRAFLVPADLKPHVTRSNGDVLPTLLVDGVVAGVWRAVDGAIEATALAPVDESAWEGLEQEARSLRGFLEPREPIPYARYGHWWSRLPAGEVRLLGRD